MVDTATDLAEPIAPSEIDLRVTPRPNDTTGAGRSVNRIVAVWLTITLTILGAILGAWWQDAQGVIHEATARVAFAEEVGFGDLDAERSLIVDSSKAIEAGESIAEVQGVELLVPPARSYIDVVARASSTEAALAATDAAVADLIETHVAIETTELDVAIAEADASIALVDDDIAELEASMADELTTEAEANAQLSGGDLSVEQREELTVAARNASDSYWNLARERNALLDQRNTYDRTQTESENARRTAGNLRIVEQSALTPMEGLDPLIASAIGGGLLGLGIALFGFWAASQIRAARR